MPPLCIADLEATAARLSRRGHGILAADESVGTIGKRLAALNLANTAEHRRAFREILICAPSTDALSGVILFHETFYQRDSSGTLFPSALAARGILPGIKVDTGLQPVNGSPGETTTAGLEGLEARCAQYYRDSARFCKWRAALRVDVDRGQPSAPVVAENAAALARYASIAQAAGLVPIVEPEILIDGGHSQQVSAAVARDVIARCYDALAAEGVALAGTLLKPMMVMPGVASEERASVSPACVAKATLGVMLDVVPRDVPGIMFLSGGMSERQATQNLDALNRLARERGGMPWSLSFSFGRALQTSAMNVWRGKEENVEEAKKVAAALAEVNARAQLGNFEGEHPSRSAGETLYEGFRGWRSGEDPKGV